MSSLSISYLSSPVLWGGGFVAGVVAPLVIVAPAQAASFADIQDHWARPFIEGLASQNLVDGYADRSFRPDQVVTLAQFEAMLEQAFDEDSIALSSRFDEQAARYWASHEFSSGGVPTRELTASEPLSRVQVLVALANGLGLYPQGLVNEELEYYTDASRIPDYARPRIVALTQNSIVVNYPDPNYLDPRQPATRADVAAFIYQALVNEGILAPLSSRSEASEYIARVSPEVEPNPNRREPVSQRQRYRVEKDTLIEVEYIPSDKVVVEPGETIELTLRVAEDIENEQGQLLIPRGSTIEGQLVPRYTGSEFIGTQFVAQTLIIGEESYPTIEASSSIVTPQSPTEDEPATLRDTVIDIVTDILIGSPRDRETTPQTEQSIILDPEADLQLTVDSEFYVNEVVTEAQTR